MKRWVKIGLIVAAIPLLVAGVVYYVLVNNLKEVLTYAIDRETKGAYAFRSKGINLSILNRTITIDSLTLTRKDTAGVLSYYDVDIPRAYLAIDSWQELLTNKRLAIDSFSVVKPSIVIHDYRVHPVSHNPTSFHTSNILENLQKTLDHLHARSFNLQGAALSLYKRKATAPFVVKDISVTIRNFSKIDNDDRRVFGSDAIELDLGRQHWVLSDGRNTLSFRGLRFSSNRQFVELDSIHYHKPTTAGQGEMHLRAEKFFFNSKHLPAIYQKGELWLDTLVCVRPVLTLPVQPKKTPVKDTTNTIHTNIKTLFRTVNIRFIQVKDGQLVLGNQGNASRAGGTQKANLTIHNLTFRPLQEHALTTDSIHLNLNNIAFFSPDSLFKISVESFALRNKDVIFRNVLYGPASYHTTGKGMTFQAPRLQLHNISLDELMQKRLVASDAELVKPNIVILATKKAPEAPRQLISATAPPKKVDLFKTLHGLAQLLQVEDFRIIGASAQYKLSGDKPMDVGMSDLTARILLNDFLESDALIDMKHAIPKLTVGKVKMETANKTNVRLTNYTLDGKKRHNWVDNLQMNLPNGTAITARNLYWEAFAWDALQQAKDIQIELLRVQELDIDVKPVEKKTERSVITESDAPAPSKKPLPKLHIAQLMAGQLHLKAALPKQTMAGFQGSAIRVDKLSTETTHFRWAQFSGKLTNLYVSQTGSKQLSVANVTVNSHQTTTLNNLRFVDNGPTKTMEVALPQLRVHGPFNSTDFSAIHLRSLDIDRPELTMVTQGKQQPAVPAKAFAVPLTFSIQELSVNGAKLNLTTKKDTSATQVKTVVSVAAQALQGTKHEAVTFASLRVSPFHIDLISPAVNTTGASANVQLTNGRVRATTAGKPSLSAHLHASLTAHALHPVLKAKKNATPPQLTIKGIDGNIDLPNFQWVSGTKIPWTTWVDHANLAITDLSFTGKSTAINAEKVSWAHKDARLQLNNFQVVPTLTKEEFMTPPQLQADYITVKGNEVQLNGFNTARWHNDSTIAIHHILVKNSVTDVSRDKRLPDPAFIPEKLMPTRLIGKIRIPFHIDSVSVVNSDVIYHETSKVTNRVGAIPLKEINGVLKNVTNRPTKVTDSLVLKASTKLLGLHIQRLHYRESYADSLAGFHMLLKTSAVNLPELTQITNPMAAADIDGGYVKPILARIAGNKYASVGNMHFHYKDLKIRLLGHADTTRKSLLIKFENFVVGKVLRKKNEEDTRIFYDRDPKKFIFGYWIKSIMSGVLTSVGVKGNKKYHANYLKLSQQHTLPSEE